MPDFQRYAVYYLPDDAELAAFGASWLGWDITRGATVEQPDIDGIEEATRTPRKYGFHGTLKPPFHPADGSTIAKLQNDIATLASETSAVTLDGLTLSRIGSFLALVPLGDTRALASLAFACVARLDGHRGAASADELERRRAAGLTPRQDTLLVQWGYPYVADEFRFHLTLSGKLNEAVLDRIQDAAANALPQLRAPFHVGSVALVGECTDGTFREIRRYPLNG